MKHKHTWILLCVNCEEEDGDDVYECEECGEEKYITMEEKLKEAKK